MPLWCRWSAVCVAAAAVRCAGAVGGCVAGRVCLERGGRVLPGAGARPRTGGQPGARMADGAVGGGRGAAEGDRREGVGQPVRVVAGAAEPGTNVAKARARRAAIGWWCSPIGLWRQQFAADPAVLGRIVLVDQAPYEVIGVMPATSSSSGRASDLWVPLPFAPGTPATAQRSHWPSGDCEQAPRSRPHRTSWRRWYPRCAACLPGQQTGAGRFG